MEHYFSDNSNTKENIKPIEFYINKETLRFLTNNAVFSKDSIDFGSRLLVETILEEGIVKKGTLLDVGCGYGTLSLTLLHFNKDLKATLVDVNQRALALSTENAKALQLSNRTDIFKSDVFEAVKGEFDYIITNPPIRAGKNVVLSIYDGAYAHLNDKGRLYVVIQKKQGAPSSIKHLEKLFGNCEIIAKKSGYYILCSVKN